MSSDQLQVTTQGAHPSLTSAQSGVATESDPPVLNIAKVISPNMGDPVQSSGQDAANQSGQPTVVAPKGADTKSPASGDGTHAQSDAQHIYPEAVPRALLMDLPVVPMKHTNKRASLGDYEAEDLRAFDFTEKTIRRSFIRKVYAILLSQLLVTTTFITVFVYHEPTKQFVRHSNMQYVILGSFAVVLFALLPMLCFEELRRKSPHNFIFLGVFTVAMSIPLGVISSLMDSHVVILAIGVTAAICLSLTLFAFQTKWDFTMMGGFLITLLVVLTIFGLYALFLPTSWHTAMTAFGVVLFGCYLVYDTQLIMGGEHKYSISPEEYVFAALTLYLDIINIFVRILRLMR